LAGLGRKEFNSGDILLASEVQGYLQDQAVMVFDDATARGSAIPSPSEGMLTYNKDTDQLELYDGSAFGPVGSDSGLIHINTTTFSAVAAQSINDVFSSTYDNYKIVMNSTCSGNVLMNFRYRVSGADNTANDNYSLAYELANFGAATENSGPTTASIVGLFWIYRNYTTIEVANPMLAVPKITQSQGMSISSSAGNRIFRVGNAYKDNTNTFTGFTIFPGSGTITGTISVFGVRK
jgi:hypothetical protein